MDSLLANYASSDEEDADQQQPQRRNHPEKVADDYPSETTTIRPSSSIFSSLPPPKSSLSLSQSLPPPKSTFPNSTKTLINPQFPKSDNHDEEEERQRLQVDDVDSEARERSSSSAAYSSSPGKSSSLFLSLPEPKQSSVFSSLPPPKSHQLDSPPLTNQAMRSSLSSSLPEPKASSVFSSLPPPKAHQADSKESKTTASSLDPPKPKKIVQFRPPVNAAFTKSRNSDDEDDSDKEEKERKRSKEFPQTASVKSFLSSIPAPKNAVGLGAVSSSGSGRRAVIDADIPASNHGTQIEVNEISVGSKASISNEFETGNEVNEVSVYSNSGNYEGQWVEGSSYSAEYTVGGVGTDPSYWASTHENPVQYDSSGYGDYSNYGQYESKWIDKSEANAAPDMSEMVASVPVFPGKRGRNEIPLDIVEVKQDELIKNRPRQDQVKLTGIAFGPSYQPVSTKGKPTKLHKRKHQIGSLYFDMRQKEMELAERRAKGFLTKAETQAKYGW